MKLRLTIDFVFDIEEENYPAGFTVDDILRHERDELEDDLFGYLNMVLPDNYCDCPINTDLVLVQ